ncbi:hypothetical protein BKA56DRAFT_278824 [Ilyonectria sp. MPI-CAGE-AT-0026]|nr:hypothetical protein BKA56DRAFT_278824 [Ilyonectria sp. MPI-CAGE-AT-0026]
MLCYSQIHGARQASRCDAPRQLAVRGSHSPDMMPPGCCLAPSRVGLPRGTQPSQRCGCGRLHRCWGGGRQPLCGPCKVGAGRPGHCSPTASIPTSCFSPCETPRLQIPFTVDSTRRETGANSTRVRASRFRNPVSVAMGRTGRASRLSCRVMGAPP